jgi:hypothetical protein
MHAFTLSRSSIAAIADELAKIASSRLDREIRAGRLQYHDVNPAIPAGQMPSMLEPAAKRNTRSFLSSPADVAPEALARRRELNAAVTRAQLGATGENLGVPGMVMKGKLLPGVGPATLVNQNVHSDENAGRFFRGAVGEGGFLGKVRAGAGSVNPALLPKAKPVDGTLNRAILQHEIGEAAELGRKVVAPHASHLGVEPIVREQLHAMGDPAAVRVMGKARTLNPDDAFVQKAIRQVGGTPDAPIPLGGKQHRALDRILSRSGEKLSPAARQRSLQFALSGKDISHMPAHIKEDLSNLPKAVKALGDQGRPLLQRFRESMPILKRYGNYIKHGL